MKDKKKIFLNGGRKKGNGWNMSLYTGTKKHDDQPIQLSWTTMEKKYSVRYNIYWNNITACNPVFHVRRTLGGINNWLGNWVSKRAGHRRAPGDVIGAAHSICVLHILLLFDM